MNSVKKFIRTSIIILCILALGMIILCTLNFNKSFDFTGGTIVKVNTTTFETANAKEKIVDIMKEYKIYDYSFIDGKNDSGETVITIKYTENKSEFETEIKNSLFTSFGYDSNDEVEGKYVSLISNVDPVYTNAVFLDVFLGVLIVGVACAIYMFARYKIPSAFILIAQLIIDIGLLLSTILVLRLEITGIIGIAIIGTAVFSVIYSFINIRSLTLIANEETNQKLSNTEIVKIGTDAKTGFILAMISIGILFVTMCFAGISTISTLISLSFGVIFSFITSNTILPYLWEISYRRKKKVPKIKNKIETA